MLSSSTIAAFATPQGSSAIAVIRVSGPLVLEIIQGAFKKALPEPRRAYYGAYVSVGNAVLDECVWIYFSGPASYTGEDSLEINCHGNAFIFKRILSDLIDRGCKVAEPGEFTKRAFLNGKMDLTQAEAVSEIISANSERAFDAARKLLSGELGKRISRWNDAILTLLAETETQIDFSDEEVPEIDADYFKSKISTLTDELKRTADTARYSARIHEGINVVIVGAPNAGKSSLLNTMIGADRALVSDEAGTTRDFIREKININGNCINIIDTAGIRDDADSKVERFGIERSVECAHQADLLILVVDVSSPPPALSEAINNTLELNKTLVVFNKTDLRPAFNTEEYLPGFDRISLSLFDSNAVVDVKRKLSEVLEKKDIVPSEDVLVVSSRHAEALIRAEESLSDAAKDIGVVPIEFVSAKLRSALEELSEILGTFDNEKVLDKVFSGFCIGK